MESEMGVFAFLVFFLISSVYSDDSPALPRSPISCFGRNLLVNESSNGNRCDTLNYPLSSYIECGYPGFEVQCNQFKDGGKALIPISNHTYTVLDINYDYKEIRLLDIDVEGSACPQPKRNFSFPSSPSWVNYNVSTNQNLTVFYNCSSVPSYAEQHLLCSVEDYKITNTPLSYAFSDGEMPKGFDWYGNCAENVVVLVGSSNRDGPNYSHAMNFGFTMGWSATDWCEDCEFSGGMCWSSSHDNSTACVCKDQKSYVATCPHSPSSTLSPPHQVEGKRFGLKIMIYVLAGVGGLLFLVGLLVYTKNKIRMIKNKSPIDVKAFLESYGCPAVHRYTYLDIKKITNSFKDKLGEGGYGQVYKGKLRDGRLVAVKVCNESKSDGQDFINEVATIGRTNHVNVVTLVGFCIEETKRALVYEFMPNGSLERFIYTRKEPATIPPLGWEKLYEIALGIARGLDYLHRGCNTRILHFDIKPHNILLDQDFCPKISDFGLAKLYPTGASVVSTVGARGTMGYIAPELCYRNFGGVSHKSDVYSYGMMMLEMVGGRNNIDTTVGNISAIYFPFWIYDRLMRNNDANDLKDMHEMDVFENEKAKRMIIVALWCIQAHPMERPSMSKVVEMLEGNPHDLQMPPNPSLDPRATSSNS